MKSDKNKVGDDELEVQDINASETDKVEDTELEVLDEEGGEKSLTQKIKDLKVKLKESEQKAKEYLDGWQRARADLVNKDKQLSEDKARIIKMASAELVESLLPTLDGYEMARKNLSAWEKVDSNWRTGIEYLFSNMKTVLEQHGLSTLAPRVGDKFDVSTMQAVEEVQTQEEEKDHTVAELIQSGYTLNGIHLREAKVKVFVKK